MSTATPAPTAETSDRPVPRPRITGIVHTRNEEQNIARVLASLTPICDELLVADMGSTDGTRAIAVQAGARVVPMPEFGYVEPARALALHEATGEWVLRIDADELVPPALAVRLRAIAEGDEADAVEIARLNFMFGRPIRATGWAPDRHYFFFKRDVLEADDLTGKRIHVGLRPAASARVAVLPAVDALSVWHFNYTDWSHFLTKLDRYTSVEARQLDGDALAVRALLAQLRTEVVDRGLRGRAWRDGYRGWGLVAMMCGYRLATWLKARQLREVGDDAQIRSRYDRLSDELLAGADAARVLEGI